MKNDNGYVELVLIGILVAVMTFGVFVLPGLSNGESLCCPNTDTPNCNNPCQQFHTVNVTIIGTDYGSSFSPYYIFASDGYRYNSGRELYAKMQNPCSREVKLTYIVEGYDSNTGCEIRRIKSITPLCVPVVCGNSCVRTCGCGC
jgi:hypothetical protein